MTHPALKRTGEGWLLQPPGLHAMEERARWLPFLLLIVWYLIALLELDIPGGDSRHALALGVAIILAVPWNIWLNRLGPARSALFAADKVTLLIRDPWSRRVNEEEVGRPAVAVEIRTLKVGETGFLRELKIAAEDWRVAFPVSGPLRMADAEEFIGYLEDNGYAVTIGEQAPRLRGR